MICCRLNLWLLAYLVLQCDNFLPSSKNWLQQWGIHTPNQFYYSLHNARWSLRDPRIYIIPRQGGFSQRSLCGLEGVSYVLFEVEVKHRVAIRQRTQTRIPKNGHPVVLVWTHTSDSIDFSSQLAAWFRLNFYPLHHGNQNANEWKNKLIKLIPNILKHLSLARFSEVLIKTLINQIWTNNCLNRNTAR